MRASELVVGRSYAVKEHIGGEVKEAVFVGTQVPKGHKSYYTVPHFTTLNRKGKQYTFWLPTAHRVIAPWEEWTRFEVDKVDDGTVLTKQEIVSKGMKEAVFQTQYEDIETLALLLKTFDVSSGIVCIKTPDITGVVTEEPALFVRHSDAKTMMDLARKMGLYAATEDLLD